MNTVIGKNSKRENQIEKRERVKNPSKVANRRQADIFGIQSKRAEGN